MQKPIVKLYTKDVSGTLQYYPRNQNALYFTQLIKQQYISKHVLYFIVKLGFEVTIAPNQSAPNIPTLESTKND